MNDFQNRQDAEDANAAPGQLTLASEVMPDTLFLLPLSERPFFPAQTLPLLLDENPWLQTFKGLYDRDQQVVGLVFAHTGSDRSLDQLRPSDFEETGTVARIHRVVRDQGRIQFVAEGLRRFRISRWLQRHQPYIARVEYPEEAGGKPDDDTRAYAMAIINTIRELVPLNPLYSEEVKHYLNRFHPNDPSPLADFAASLTTADSGDLQEVIDTVPVLERMKKVLVLLRKELDVAKAQASIREQVDEQVSDQQRKFFLREQLKAIQRELGIAKDDRTAEVERFRQRLQDLSLPEAADDRIDEELDKLSVLESGSPEYAVTRNYLDVMTKLPWGRYSRDNLDLDHARRVLDRDHYGLDDVKRRIVEFLAVGALKGEVSGSILLLVGPPGVGKTSVGRSIASALDRRFYRFSLGGMRDEAEIKGHRRTYIGAMPGKAIQALREVGTSNPVIMLDEVDKLGMSFQGDPASALLEVLDPEQNSEFLDHYLDVRYDLSKVLFICTANQLDTIPAPLLDRLEVIRLAGYITDEKVAIARRYLWPRQLERSGLTASQIRITPAAVRHVVEGYAREAGVRNLEKQLGRIIRKAAVDIVEHPDRRIRVGVRDLDHYLGKPLFRSEKPAHGVGVVTGLAWTALGGATLTIEATRVYTGQRGFKLTGNLGDVMQESANIAYSYVASNVPAFGGDPVYFDQAFLHLHVPEGATPKDGPSAGITMATALLSLARDERLQRPLAMTGELTLTGQVLPVGGIREKIIAARRSGVLELILPEDNRRDYEELPEYLTRGLTVHFVRHFREVARQVFPHRRRARPAA
ncbi:MAG TPA: endopeptidase La [Gammaproteobacteria bacterium]|nr:endopeptidase La [Gammaproteobacteria bacterium]